MAGIISCCLLLTNQIRSAWYRPDGMEGTEIYCRYRGEIDASPDGLSFFHTVRAAQRSAVKGVRACVQHTQHTCGRGPYCTHHTSLCSTAEMKGCPAARNEAVRKIGPTIWG